MDLTPSLSQDMSVDSVTVTYLRDAVIAREFYSALCNMDWYKIEDITNEDRVIRRLQGTDEYVWSCSWRGAGFIIADIRNKHYNTNETYMDYYCSGDEGRVSSLVEECFKNIGWYHKP